MVLSLVYYGKERARWPGLTGHSARLSEAEALIAVAKLQRHFMSSRARARYLRPIRVTFHGTGGSRAWAGQITFAHESSHGCLNWLTVAHEFAHCWDIAMFPGHEFRRHDRNHAKLVDRACRYLTKLGWRTGELAHQVAVVRERRAERAKAAAMPPSPDARIAQREAQVRRLERKMKALGTRLKKAKRSLNALKRAHPDPC